MHPADARAASEDTTAALCCQPNRRPSRALHSGALAGHKLIRSPRTCGGRSLAVPNSCQCQHICPRLPIVGSLDPSHAARSGSATLALAAHLLRMRNAQKACAVALTLKGDMHLNCKRTKHLTPFTTRCEMMKGWVAPNDTATLRLMSVNPLVHGSGGCS